MSAALQPKRSRATVGTEAHVDAVTPQDIVLSSDEEDEVRWGRVASLARGNNNSAWLVRADTHALDCVRQLFGPALSSTAPGMHEHKESAPEEAVADSRFAQKLLKLLLPCLRCPVYSLTEVRRHPRLPLATLSSARHRACELVVCRV